ncbi:protein C-mannosyl-transferase DPY19L3-like [Tachypleus tridentatus]|uniref:protein C-mannosyl-transferase DPY19L3-like n=1 Tax=Tachypleus tridentatus TaxID=6853 RepID=UPI003FD3A497
MDVRRRKGRKDTGHKNERKQHREGGRADNIRHTKQQTCDIKQEDLYKLSKEEETRTPASETLKPVQDASFGFWNNLSWVLNCMCGCLIGLVLACSYSWYMETLHENEYWFTNIGEVEREISFRTEQGLYYSYYKHLINSPSIIKGVQQLMRDNFTECGRTINILNRFNIYQEIILASAFKLFVLNQYIEPIFFYTKSVFALSGFGLGMLYICSWLVNRSWLSAMLTGVIFILNKTDATRVYFTVPLRESFALPFLFAQTTILCFYMKHTSKHMSLVLIFFFLFSFLFTLTWQFSQFVLLFETIILFLLCIVKLIPAEKVLRLLFLMYLAVFCVVFSQFGQKMLLGSFVTSFIPVASFYIWLRCARNQHQDQKHVSLFAFVSLIVCVSGLSLGLNWLIRFSIGINSDTHIFKYIQDRIFSTEPKDFEAKLYTCNPGFYFIDTEFFQRLTGNFLLPFYLITIFLVFHAGTFYFCKIMSFIKKTHEYYRMLDFSPWLIKRPEVVFLSLFSFLLGLLACFILRMKFLWVPYMCVLAPLVFSDLQIWSLNDSKSLRFLLVKTASMTIKVTFIGIVCYKFYNIIQEEMIDLKEFWDPDTVELMEWIKTKTPSGAVFAGSMQLMAGVKLCTGRPITNHPHFEDKWLRERTKQVYQIYSRRDPEYVHRLLEDIGASYIILEDSICLAPPRDGCTLPEIMDIHNKISYYYSLDKSTIETSQSLFCDAIRYLKPTYSKYFALVFQNKTFRVYTVLHTQKQ